MVDEIIKPVEMTEEPTISDVVIEPVATEAPVVEPVTETVITEVPVIIEEPVVGPVVKDSNPKQIEAKPLSAPEPTLSESVPTLVTSPSSLEPNPRPYSLDPKLNKMIEAFVRGMKNSKENLILANKAVKAKMMKRVYKVMDMFKKHKQVKNDDVEKFLHVSDDTATKYLNILTKEGKIKREGSPHSPNYIKLD